MAIWRLCHYCSHRNRRLVSSFAITGVIAAVVWLAAVGLYTNDPTDANTGTEVSGASYSRKSVAFAAPSNGVTASSADVIFDAATTNWGTITHIGILDALTSGNLLYHTQLDASKTIDTNDIFRINSSALTVTIA